MYEESTSISAESCSCMAPLALFTTRLACSCGRTALQHLAAQLTSHGILEPRLGFVQGHAAY